MSADFPVEAATVKQITPEVTWAQRSNASDPAKNYIYLTISVPDVPAKDMKLDLQPTSISFTGHSDSKKATYHVAFDFFAEIDPEKSIVHHSARDVEIKLQKKELKEEFWPRLLKDAKKVHYLKTDFDKWVDEDEQDGVPDDDMMNQFGGGGAGMPGMGGADGGFGGLDFSKLGGGAGGMPDLSAMAGMEGMGGMGGDDDDEDGDDNGDDDDDMPELEEEGKSAPSQTQSTAGASGDVSAATTKAKSKIEEVE